MLNSCIISTFKLPLVGSVCSLCDGQNLGKHKPQNLCSLRGGYGASIPAFDKAVQQQTNHPPSTGRPRSWRAGRGKTALQNGAGSHGLTVIHCALCGQERHGARASSRGFSPGGDVVSSQRSVGLFGEQCHAPHNSPALEAAAVGPRSQLRQAPRGHCQQGLTRRLSCHSAPRGVCKQVRYRRGKGLWPKKRARLLTPNLTDPLVSDWLYGEHPAPSWTPPWLASLPSTTCSLPVSGGDLSHRSPRCSSQFHVALPRNITSFRAGIYLQIPLPLPRAEIIHSIFKQPLHCPQD